MAFLPSADIHQPIGCSLNSMTQSSRLRSLILWIFVKSSASNASLTMASRGGPLIHSSLLNFVMASRCFFSSAIFRVISHIFFSCFYMAASSCFIPGISRVFSHGGGGSVTSVPTSASTMGAMALSGVVFVAVVGILFFQR